MTSQLAGFYNLNLEDRLNELKRNSELTEEEIQLLRHSINALGFELSNRMVENVVSCFSLPLGIALNFKINGTERIIPMAIEEPSVIAGASKAAKLALPKGFTAKASEQIMIGQIQLVNVKNFQKAKKAILKNKKNILKLANAQDKTLIQAGGGAKNIEVREVKGKQAFLVIHLLVDVRDAMGANAINTMCEAISSKLEELSGGEARLRILTNLAIHRIVEAKAIWKKEVIGKENINKILQVYYFADADIFRATTNNKGIMNGVDAVVIATGNDFRATEAACHAYASLSGQYKPLAKYSKNKNGDLVGEIELPLALGIVGGATRTHPLAKVCLKLMKIKSAKELSEIVACVGLAQNFAAIYALATEGIQRGHMKLHANNIAVLAGARPNEIKRVSEKMVKEGNVKADRAKEILRELRKNKRK